MQITSGEFEVFNSLLQYSLCEPPLPNEFLDEIVKIEADHSFKEVVAQTGRELRNRSVRVYERAFLVFFQLCKY